MDNVTVSNLTIKKMKKQDVFISEDLMTSILYHEAERKVITFDTRRNKVW